MKRKTKWMIAAPATLAVLAVILILAFRNDDATAEVPTPAAEVAAAPVRVTEVREMTLPRTVGYSGTIEPWEQALVVGPSGARIARIHVREGDRVQRGQVLVEMENANLQQAVTAMNQAKNDMERLERLVEVGSVSRQQYEQARVQYETAASNVSLLQQNTHLRAPISGVVTGKHFVEGEMFMPAVNAPSIVTVMQTNPVKVVVNASERYYPMVRPGTPASVLLDTYGTRPFSGRVERVHPTVDADSRTFRVEVRIDNAEQLLSPGMFARVELGLGEVSGYFLPRMAVMQSPGSDTYFVYLVEGETARRQPVEVGDRVENYQEVLGGLPENALVVSEGMGRLSDGAPVRIVASL